LHRPRVRREFGADAGPASLSSSHGCRGALATLALAAFGALAAWHLRRLVAYLVLASAGMLLLGVGLGTRARSPPACSIWCTARSLPRRCSCWLTRWLHRVARLATQWCRRRWRRQAATHAVFPAGRCGCRLAAVRRLHRQEHAAGGEPIRTAGGRRVGGRAAVDLASSSHLPGGSTVSEGGSCQCDADRRGPGVGARARCAGAAVALPAPQSWRPARSPATPKRPRSSCWAQGLYRGRAGCGDAPPGGIHAPTWRRSNDAALPGTDLIGRALRQLAAAGSSLSAGHVVLALVLALSYPGGPNAWCRSRPHRFLGGGDSLALIVLYDIVASAVTVARQILGPEERIRPGFVWVPLAIRDAYGTASLASIITMTPGTLSSTCRRTAGTYWCMRCMSTTRPS